VHHLCCQRRWEKQKGYGCPASRASQALQQLHQLSWSSWHKSPAHPPPHIISLLCPAIYNLGCAVHAASGDERALRVEAAANNLRVMATQSVVERTSRRIPQLQSSRTTRLRRSRGWPAGQLVTQHGRSFED
jgi:hypothetical protein